jgi:hypothetical protein
LRVRRQSLAKAIAPQPSGARRRGDQAAEANVTKQPDVVQLFTPQIGWPLFDLPSLTGAAPGMAPLFRATVPPIDGLKLKYITLSGQRPTGRLLVFSI